MASKSKWWNSLKENNHGEPPMPISRGRMAKQSFTSPTSKAKRVLSERNEEEEEDIFATGETPSLEQLQRKLQYRDATAAILSEVYDKHSFPYHPFHASASDHVSPSASPFSCGMSSLGGDEELPPYDPKTNFTSPRPQFLRYRPNRKFDLIFQGDDETPQERYEECKDKQDDGDEIYSGSKCFRRNESHLEGFTKNEGFKEMNEIPQERYEEREGKLDCVDEIYSGCKGFRCNKPRLEDFRSGPLFQGFTEIEDFEEVNEIDSLGSQMKRIDLTGESGCETKHVWEARHGVIADEDMPGSCFSAELVMPEEEVLCKPSNSALEPNLDVVEESGINGGMEGSQRRACSISNVVSLMLVALFVSIAVVASGSPGLLPSVLLDNPLATAWHSSKFYGPAMEASRGARGFWKQDIVQPAYFDLDLQALQKQDSALRIRGNGFWISVKEFCLEMLKKIWPDAKNLQEYSVSPVNSNPHGVIKSSHVEDSSYAIIRDDENSNYADDEQAKMTCPLCRSEVNPFEEGVWAEHGHLPDSPYGILTSSSEAQIPGQIEILDGSISSAEKQFPEEGNTSAEGLDITNVEAENCSMNQDQMEVQINAEDAPVIRDSILDYVQVTEKVPVEAQKDTHSFKDNIFKIVLNQKPMLDGSDESEADYSVHDSLGFVLSSPGSEKGSELQSYEINSEVEPSDTIIIEDPEGLGVTTYEDQDEMNVLFSEDQQELSVSINEYPDELGLPINEDADELGPSINEDSEEVGLRMNENIEEFSMSIDGDEAHDFAVLKQFGTPEFESPYKFEDHGAILIGQESPNHMEAVMSEAEKSREGVLDIFVAEDSKHLGAVPSSTSDRSVESLLLYGVAAAFFFAAAVVCAFLVNSYRKRATYANPKTSPESVKEIQAKTNDPTQHDPLTRLSKMQTLYSQCYNPNSLQNTPNETLYEWKGSSVPSVQLLNEYSPSQVVSSSAKKKDNMWNESSIRGNSFYNPTVKVRRKGNSASSTDQENVITQEISTEDSSYSFPTMTKEDLHKEQLKVTPVRRSDRIRNRTKSPPRSPTRSPPRSPSRRQKN